MTTPQHIAKHFREVFFGGNWTWSNLRDNLKDVTWQQATTKVGDFNTIAALTYHMTYYVDAVLKVLQGKPLDSSDKLSWETPAINSQQDWENLLNKAWNDVEQFVALLEQMPEDKLWENFTDPKYGIYYRNLHGIIEHTHYHLGQIAIIKKLVR